MWLGLFFFVCMEEKKYNRLVHASIYISSLPVCLRQEKQNDNFHRGPLTDLESVDLDIHALGPSCRGYPPSLPLLDSYSSERKKKDVEEKKKQFFHLKKKIQRNRPAIPRETAVRQELEDKPGLTSFKINPNTVYLHRAGLFGWLKFTVPARETRAHHTQRRPKRSLFYSLVFFFCLLHKENTVCLWKRRHRIRVLKIIVVVLVPERNTSFIWPR